MMPKRSGVTITIETMENVTAAVLNELLTKRAEYESIGEIWSYPLSQ